MLILYQQAYYIDKQGFNQAAFIKRKFSGFTPLLIQQGLRADIFY
jgi:hypothetical protein